MDDLYIKNIMHKITKHLKSKNNQLPKSKQPVKITSKTPEITLVEMLNKMTSNNLHSAIDWGQSVGQEVW